MMAEGRRQMLTGECPDKICGNPYVVIYTVGEICEM